MFQDLIVVSQCPLSNIRWHRFISDITATDDTGEYLLHASLNPRTRKGSKELFLLFRSKDAKLQHLATNDHIPRSLLFSSGSVLLIIKMIAAKSIERGNYPNKKMFCCGYKTRRRTRSGRPPEEGKEGTDWLARDIAKVFAHPVSDKNGWSVIADNWRCIVCQCLPWPFDTELFLHLLLLLLLCHASHQLRVTSSWVYLLFSSALLHYYRTMIDDCGSGWFIGTAPPRVKVALKRC